MKPQSSRQTHCLYVAITTSTPNHFNSGPRRTPTVGPTRTPGLNSVNRQARSNGRQTGPIHSPRNPPVTSTDTLLSNSSTGTSTRREGSTSLSLSKGGREWTTVPRCDHPRSTQNDSTWHPLATTGERTTPGRGAPVPGRTRPGSPCPTTMLVWLLGEAVSRTGHSTGGLRCLTKCEDRPHPGRREHPPGYSNRSKISSQNYPASRHRMGVHSTFRP